MFLEKMKNFQQIIKVKKLVNFLKFIKNLIMMVNIMCNQVKKILLNLKIFWKIFLIKSGNKIMEIK